jgi:hypothetical protein
MIRFILTGIACLVLSIQSLYSQSGTETYLKINYIQLEADEIPAVLEGLEEWKRQNQQQVENNELTAWRFYRVVFSSNRDQTYNFISAKISPNLASLQAETRPDSNQFLEMLNQYPAQKHIVHSEIWTTQAKVYQNEAEPPSRYKNTNFMRAEPDRLDDYLELEVDIAKPLHQNQADNNRMEGWNFYQLTFPTGTSVAYNFITADYYSSLEQIEMGITREVIKEVHPDMDVDEFEDFADSIRERVWSDLWELLEYAE